MQKININEYIDKFFEHKINASRLFNNPKVSFFIILNLVLLIGCYNLLNNNTRNAIMTIISYPIVLLTIIAICLIVAYNNLPVGILLLLGLFIILYPSSENNKDNNLQIYTNDIKIVEEGFSNNNSRNNNTNTSINIEGFKNNDRVRKRDEKRKEREKFTKSLPELKNNFKDVYEELEEEYENDLKSGIKENLKNLLKREKMNNDKWDNNSNTRKEKFNDISNSDSYEDEFQRREGRRERFKTITKRKFNPNNEIDSNLLITKEIFKDLINRITYEYEKPEYLKKYIENRLDEVIEINELGKD